MHCYILLSIWILLLVGGIYKFLEPKPKYSVSFDTVHYQNSVIDVKVNRIFKICNLPDEITIGEEGISETNQWTLKGLLILIRHGDRGPLQHVSNISHINCGHTDLDVRLKSYQEYLHNLTILGKISWVGPGSFHGFPILPTHTTQCQIGQLTMQGISQLLKLGQVLRESYVGVWQKLLNLTQGDVKVYSTRYRRTFQSALAFLYTFILGDVLSKITIFESQSMSFCFKDCACPIADKFYRLVKKDISQQLQLRPAVALLSEAMGRLVFAPSAEQGGDPHSVRDALLTYICHSSNLPCSNLHNCVNKQNVAGIFAYTDWVNHQKWSNLNWKRYCLLKSYGLIKHIVSQMLHMVSNTGPYFLLYSGHDHTLEQLSTALGLENNPHFLRYASRIIIEVYNDNRQRLNGARDMYFRILTNGKDVTNQVHFCKELVNVRRGTSLCKIEDIVRFIHEDYFSSLNFTNFKDACATTRIS
ncbi:hypothetical protein RN001_013468 [Aquatica leii]|uniref:2-phosphoxylose phosphatase 1 n=1 Tax=Aquatica leii TaxID=1421715 RepID=A0AAN7SLM0_9COLE|nr:hypothetical protein RN001_013468 [Aquatica leii]